MTNYLKLPVFAICLIFGALILFILKSTDTYAHSSDHHILYSDVISTEKACKFKPQGTVDGEIKVIGNNQSISDGDSKPSAKDSTYFGLAHIDSTTITKTYWIKYTGPDSLVIEGLISSSSEEFVVSKQPSATVVASGDSVSFEVTYIPLSITDEGKYTQATIIVPNNVSDENAFSFDVQGEGAGIVEAIIKGNYQHIKNNDIIPEVGDFTSFGEADIKKDTITHTFWILNEGNYEMALGDITSNSPEFIIKQPFNNIVPKGDSISFQISFDPSIAGDAFALINVPSTDNQGNDLYIFAVNGIGTENPVIEVEGLSVLITNGDTTPGETDDTYYGRTDIEGNGHTHTFWIHNRGTAALLITQLISSSLSEFSVVQPIGLSSSDTLSIPSEDSISFTVTFKPEELKGYISLISIESNDKEDSLYTFHVGGKGSGKVDISVKGNNQLIANGDITPSSKDNTLFNSLIVNLESETHSFWIVNSGNDTLHVESPILMEHEGEFELIPPSHFSIPPSDSVSFKVSYAPTDEGSDEALITIHNDDQDDAIYIFKVVAEGGIPYFNGLPVAVSDSFATPKEEVFYANVLTENGIDTLSHDGDHRVYLLHEVSQGQLTLEENGDFTYLPPTGFWGLVSFTYELCDKDNDCSTAKVNIQVEGSGIKTYNAFSPDDDGINDSWEIDNIHNYPENQVSIFNRWGNVVWEMRGYDNEGVSWKGEANTGLKVGSKLPDGTYFYIIQAEGLSNEQGYIVISRNR